VTCHTPRQMQLANALCRLVEMAQEDRAPSSGRARDPAEIEGESPTRNGSDPVLAGVQLSWLGEPF